MCPRSSSPRPFVTLECLFTADTLQFHHLQGTALIRTRNAQTNWLDHS